MKKTISLVLSFVVLFSLALSVRAEATENRIYSETIKAEKGSTVEIPVKIENNTGIMGFAIDVSYDSDIIIPVSVEGSDLLNGMLNDSIETSEAGSFIVLYTSAESFCSNGTIFTLKFNVIGVASGNISVDLSYTQDDTFDESFNNVVLNCETIIISFDSNSSKPTNPDDPASPTDPDDPASPTDPDDPASPTDPDDPASPTDPDDPASPTDPDDPASPTDPDDPASPTDPDDPGPGEEDLKLSVRIKNWAAGLDSPWNTVMSIIVAPLVFVLQLFGR